MAISIQNALQLPIMRKTRLVAGKAGMKNQIKWVTIVEVLEDIERLQSGEFLITTGFGLIENKRQMEAFHSLLQSNLLSGVAIYTGFYMKEIPKSFIELANTNELPLIEIPTDINFSDITKALLQQIVNNQMHLLEQAENIHRELTSLILDDKSLSIVTERLGQLTDSEITIYNATPQVIYRNRNAQFFSDDTRVRINDQEADIKPYLKDSLSKEAKVNFAMDPFFFTVYPIIAKQSCYGWIVMKKEKADWQEIHDLAIEQAAPIYAIEFLKQQAVEETQLRIQNNFLTDIFNRNYVNEETLLDQAEKFGYDLSLNQAAFYLSFKETQEGAGMMKQLSSTVVQLLGMRKKQHLIQTKLDSLIFLTDIEGETSKEHYEYSIELAKAVVKNWRYQFRDSDMIVGIGKCYRDIRDLRKSAEQAKISAELYDLLDTHDAMAHYEDLGIYSLLLDMEQGGIKLSEVYGKYIQELINKERQGVDFIETLDIFFKNNLSIQDAAEQLFIHRHTFRYRLNQIERRTGLEIKSSDDLLKLQLGVMSYKLEKLLKQPKAE